ncbi:Decaprenyl diphosphate synthase-like protein [Hysterangium stoloniferum]|nr:Decaprenyl diphosphate synthase-like protein [Hysterangium stoloniferum]
MSSSTTQGPLQWLYNPIFKFLQRILLDALASGPIPNHIAFILDGNRRYARRVGIPVHEGHQAGGAALSRVLEICLRLGVHSTTVFAFSIDNFRRPPAEVDALMDSFRKHLHDLSQHGSLLETYGVQLRVLGNISLLPQQVKEAAKKAEEFSRHHDKAVINLMIAYTARDEMATAVQTVVRRTLDEESSPDLITEEDIDRELYVTSVENPWPVDILVRTSGVKRFSDFLLWQCSEDVQVHFIPVYWPDIGFSHIFQIILDYQRKIWSRRLLSPQ